MTRTQSGMSTLAEQAAFAVRIARGQGYRYEAVVLGFRAGSQNALWRPNEVCAVWDPFAQIDDDMIVSRVVYGASERGLITQLSLAGRTAFDRINESERRRRRHHADEPVARDSRVTPLQRDSVRGGTP